MFRVTNFRSLKLLNIQLVEKPGKSTQKEKNGEEKGQGNKSANVSLGPGPGEGQEELDRVRAELSQDSVSSCSLSGAALSSGKCCLLWECCFQECEQELSVPSNNPPGYLKTQILPLLTVVGWENSLFHFPCCDFQGRKQSQEFCALGSPPWPRASHGATSQSRN